MFRPRSLYQLYLTRLREFVRQPSRIFWVYGFPLLMALVLGIAFRNRPPAVVEVDLVRNAGAGAVSEALRADARFRIVELDRPAALHRLKTGKTTIVVEAAPGGGVVYHLDPTREQATAARSAFDDALQRAFGRKDVVATTEEKIVEPGSRYIDFLIPGLIGMNALGGGLWGVGYLIVNFRAGGLLKRFVATPMPRENFLMAILLARLTFVIPDCGLLLLFGRFVFGMPIRGSLAVFLLLEIVGSLSFAGIGLLVSSRARATETVNGLMNLVMLPMWLLSGVFFSSNNYPGWFQPVIQALPLTQLVSALRLVLLEGAGLGDAGILKALAILSAWGIGCFLLALRIFRWQ